MIKRVEKMVMTLLPDAIPGEDFTVESLPDGTVEIVHWDSEKLGLFPGLKHLREMYLRFVQRRKKVIPNYDDSDPLPYLAEKPKETVRRAETPPPYIPTVEVINGVAFARRK